jgi:hypothetical protein
MVVVRLGECTGHRAMVCLCSSREPQHSITNRPTAHHPAIRTFLRRRSFQFTRTSFGRVMCS